MKRWVILATLALATPALTQARSWQLLRSTLTYHITHPLHQAEGVSHAARGKGVCQQGTCNFLVAAPVKSFQSGDTNRDLHMLQVTRGAQYPMVVVRVMVPAAELHPGTLKANLEVQFAGQDVHYAQIPFQVSAQGQDLSLTGTIPATLTDFKITPPELLMMPIRNQIPVTVAMTWGPAGG
jgi:hypothetical protein